MRDARSWLAELARAAPGVDLTLLRLIAAMLAGAEANPAADGWADALFRSADVLRARRSELAIDGFHRLAGELAALDAILGREAKVADALARRGSFY